MNNEEKLNLLNKVDSYRDTYSIRNACKKVGISETSYYKWKKILPKEKSNIYYDKISKDNLEQSVDELRELVKELEEINNHHIEDKLKLRNDISIINNRMKKLEYILSKYIVEKELSNIDSSHL